MVPGQDRFSGNILFYEYLKQKRAPTFLNRNLTAAFHAREHLEEQGSLAGYQPPNSKHHLREIWQTREHYLSHDDLNEMMDQQSRTSSFVLSIQDIRPVTTAHLGNAGDSGLGLCLRSEGKVRISFGSVILEEHIATLTGIRNTYGPFIGLGFWGNKEQVKGQQNWEPFIIPPSVFDHEAHKTDMTLRITMSTVTALNELVAFLRPGSRLQGTDMSIQAIWKDISSAPEETQVLPLTRHGKYLGIGIGVRKSWYGKGKQSVLEQHNNSHRQSAPQIRTRSSGTSKRMYMVTYVYGNKTHTLMDLLCPHLSCTSGLKPERSINSLYRHLTFLHSYFRYERSKEPAYDGVECWRFVSDRPDHLYDQRSSRMTATAPFQQSRRSETAGDESFELESPRRPRRQRQQIRSRVTTPPLPPLPQRNLPNEVGQRLVRSKPRFKVPKVPGITFVRSYSRRPLITGELVSESDDDPEEDWLDQKIRAEIEKDEWIPSKTKEFLKDFDPFIRQERLVSDIWAGDAIIRYIREKAAWIWQKQLSEQFKDKLKELVDAGIITTEIHEGALQILEDIKDGEDNTASRPVRMSDRLARLEVVMPIDNWDLYGDRSPSHTSTILTSRHKRRLRSLRESTRLTENGTMTPITADSDGDTEMREAVLSKDREQGEHIPLPYDLCLCGSDAQTSYQHAQLVVCNSMDCIRRQFHFDCLKQHWHVACTLSEVRKRDWFCNDCSSRGAQIA